jgi:hypothetical protein
VIDGIVHLAGPRIQLGETHVRQRCAWCGVVLADTVPRMVPVDHFVRYEQAGGHPPRVSAREMVGPSEGAESPDDACWFRDPAIVEARQQARAVRAAESSARRFMDDRGRTLPGVPGCPNQPPCEHPAMIHDVSGDPEDPLPCCCSPGCDCGVAAARAAEERRARPQQATVSEFDRPGTPVPPAPTKEG